MALGKAVVNILANLKPLKRGLLAARVLVSRMVTSISRTSFNLLKSGLRKIMSLAKLAAIAILGVGIASVKVASDSVETENLFRQSFGKMADEADRWAKKYSKSLNLFEVDTKKALGTFFLMINGMGVAEDQAFKMAKGLTKLVNDLASFRNLGLEEAFLKIAAGITGESEPLKRLGIVVNETTIQMLAQKDATILARVAAEKATPKLERYGNTYLDVSKKTKTATIKLTEQEKIMLRYQDILNKTSKDQGDMARTLNDTSNVFKQIGAQIKRTADTIGQSFLPEVTKVGIALRDWFVKNQDQVREWAEVISAKVNEVIKLIKELFALAQGGEWQKLFDRIGDIFKNVLGGLVEFIKSITPKAVGIGKAIGEGFLASVKDTQLGRFLDVVGTAAKGVAKVVDVVVGEPARIFGERFNPESRDTARLNPNLRNRRNQLSPVTITTGDASTIISELQKLNRQVQRQNEDF
jgi:hypothetical protein